MTHPTPIRDPRKDYAAQNAQEGLVTVADLSFLTGVPVAQLTKYAKLGLIEHFGEYHGKRFFKFQSILAWAMGEGDDDEAKVTVRRGIEAELQTPQCPYTVELMSRRDDGAMELRLSWKVSPAAAA